MFELEARLYGVSRHIEKLASRGDYGDSYCQCLQLARALRCEWLSLSRNGVVAEAPGGE